MWFASGSKLFCCR